MSKFILIFPPLWNPEVPHIAIPLLAAQLNHNHFDTKIFDYNIDFFHYIYSEEIIKNTLKKIKKNKNELLEKLDFFYGKNGVCCEQTLPYTYGLYKKIIENRNDKFDKIPQMAEEAKKIIKTSQEKDKIASANEILRIVKNIVSIPYMPFDIESTLILPPDILFKGYECVKNTILSNENNIFSEFYSSKIEEIKKMNADYIGISINSSSQVVAGLILSKLLKENTNAHINIGGDYFSRIKDSIKEFNDFFNIFADSISYGQGENTIVSIAKYISKQNEIKDIDGLIYYDKSVKINKEPQTVEISEVPYPNYSDYNLDKYLLNVRKLPIQTNTSCYWGKCTFCDCCYLKKHREKNPNKFVEEIKYYISNFGVNDFDIIDASVSPHFLDKFADKLIENNIKITFSFLARLEEQFTYPLLKKLYDAGARKIFWGVESTSERILHLINKGIKKENITKILCDSAKAGIENRTFFFIGFPTETKDEAIQTVNYILANKKIIHSSSMALFSLGNHSTISKYPSRYGIEILNEQNSFVPILNYRSEKGMSKAEIDSIYNYYIQHSN